jgi:ADP-ribosylglycohydrolase
MQLPTPSLINRIRGCLVGVAIGDALGMPWETCSHDEILEMTNGFGVVDLQDLPPARKVNDPRGIPLGHTTDDWQLTKAAATSLIRSRRFHVFDQAAAHIEAYEVSTKGWGGSTRQAIAEFKLWFDSRGRDGRRPDVPANPGPGRGKGNGVLMKLAPLVCLAAIERAKTNDANNSNNANDESVRTNVTQLVHMTHNEDISVDIAGVFLALLEGRIESPKWSNLRPLVKQAEVRATLDGLFGADSDEKSPTIAEIRARCGTSFLATESAAYGLSLLVLFGQDFRSAVLAAINGGGDTDTNASIVGALVGANLGLAAIPNEWRMAVADASEALEVADELISTFG